MTWSHRILIPTFLGVALLLAAPWQVQAQPGGGRGGSGGGRPGGGSMGPARGYAPSIGSGYRGIGGYGNGYNSFYRNGNNFRRFPYLYPFFYPYAFGYYDNSYAPDAFGYPAPGNYLYDMNPPQGYGPNGPGEPPPGYGGNMPGGPPTDGAGGNREAVIEVVVPTEDAQVWLEGLKTNTTGTRRSFMTPPLAPGAYSYNVTAVWKQDGQDVRSERTISIVPGFTVVVDFNRPNAKPRMPLVD